MKFPFGAFVILAALFNPWASLAVAAPFICKTIQADQSGNGSATAIARISDADVRSSGFRLTGGGCQVSGQGSVTSGVPDTAAYSYTCSAAGVSDRVSIRVTAYAVACRSN